MQRFYAHGKRVLFALVLLLAAAGSASAQWTKLPADFSYSSAPAYNNWSQVAYYNGKVYMFGGLVAQVGSTSGTFLSTAWSLDVNDPNAQWQTITSMPTIRAGGYATVINNKIYIVGGYYSSGTTLYPQATVLEYDPVANSYAQKTAMPSGGQFHIAAATVGTKIYIMNGYNSAGTMTNQSAVYDASNDSWTNLAATPAASAYSTGCAVNGTLYMVGGQSASAYLTTAYKGTITGNTVTWAAIAAYPTALTRLGSGVANNNMYVAGGVNGNGESDLVYKYNSTSNTWTTTFALPVKSYNVNQMPGDGTNFYYITGLGNPSTYKFTEGAPTAVAKLTPTAVAFKIKTGTTATKGVTVTNQGTAALTVQTTMPGTAPWLSSDKLNFTVQPGTSTIMTLTANSAGMSEGSYNGTITLNTNDPNNGSISLPVNLQTFDNIEKRRPLLEVFTSSTCPPCNPGNTNLHAVIANIPRDDYTVLKYQQDFPGTGDPYCTNETYGRRGFYAINSIPRMEVDGAWDQNAQSFTATVYNTYKDILSFLRIEPTYTVNGQKVDVSVKLTPQTDYPSGSLKLYVAVCEKRTVNNVKTNGETQFLDVVKKVLPDHNGMSISPMSKGVPVTYQQSFTFPGNYRLPSDGQAGNRINYPASQDNSVEDFKNLEVIAWVQDVSTKEVLNSAWGQAGSVSTAVFSATPAMTTATIAPTTSVDFHVTLTNLTTNPLDVKLTRTNENYPSTTTGWQSSMCFGDICLPSDQAGPFTMTLLPGGTDTTFKLSVVAGTDKLRTGTVTVRFEAPAGSGQAPIDRTFTVNTTNVSGVLEDVAATGGVALGQNFPNPANGNTTLSFSLANSSHATLDVYGLNGSKVMSLIDGQRAAGLNIVQFDATKLPAGTYTVVLNAAGHKVTRQMTVVH